MDLNIFVKKYANLLMTLPSEGSIEVVGAEG